MSILEKSQALRRSLGLQKNSIYFSKTFTTYSSYKFSANVQNQKLTLKEKIINRSKQNKWAVKHHKRADLRITSFETIKTLEDIFKVMDAEESGYVSRDKVACCFINLHLCSTIKSFDKLLEKSNAKDATISLETFINLVVENSTKSKDFLKLIRNKTGMGLQSRLNQINRDLILKQLKYSLPKQAFHQVYKKASPEERDQFIKDNDRFNTLMLFLEQR